MQTSFFKSKVVLVVAGVAAGLAVVAIAAVLLAPPHQFAGSVIDPPVPAPEIALTDQNFRPFRLSKTDGKVTLLFFGYSYCPDECPATLAQFKLLKESLADKADRVRFIMVSVDPYRDTPERLTEYLAAFDPTFIGVTGTEPEMESMWKAYGIFREFVLLDGTPMADEDHENHNMVDYTVDHTLRTFVVDAEARLRMTYTSDTPTADILADVQTLLP